MTENPHPQTSFYTYLHHLQTWFGDCILHEGDSASKDFPQEFVEKFKGVAQNLPVELMSSGEFLLSQLEKKHKSYAENKGIGLSDFNSAFQDVMAWFYATAETQNTTALSQASEGGYTELVLDYKREMERLSRDGKSFCIAYLRPDSENYGILEVSSTYTLAKKHLRGFDSAYFSKDKKAIILLLKQTDRNGSVRFLKRLLGLHEKTGASFSAIVSECVIGETLESIVKNLQEDMNAVDVQLNGVIDVLQDMSPLQRHLKTVQ